MKKFFLILGVCTAAVMLIFAIVIGVAVISGSRLDSSSKLYVNTIVPKIVGHWSLDEFENASSPQLKAIAPHLEATKLFNKLSSLGTMKAFDTPSGGTFVSVTSEDGKMVTANYTVRAAFEKGPATITLRLIQVNGEWKLLAFKVDSPLFLN